MKGVRIANCGAALVLALPLYCRGAAPAAEAMPDMSDHSMSVLMGMDDAAAVGKVMLDQMELEGGAAGTAAAWEAQAWYGGDYDKAWFETEGSPDASNRDASRNELSWDHTLTRWWSVHTGMRYDLGRGPARGWAAVGLEGLAPYWFDVQATFYLGEAGRTAARFQVEHDLLITQQLVVQPEIEASVYGKNDPARQISSGLSDLQLALRLRYEIRREFAPYLGFAWRRNLGVPAPILHGGGSGTGAVQWVAGFQAWF